jgi:exodeoxyribonuclease VII small subunit
LIFTRGFAPFERKEKRIMATFEEQISKLEETVRLLERGDVSLDESLALFEQGVKLAKSCREQLDNAEKKVKILVNGEKEDFEVNEEQA